MKKLELGTYFIIVAGLIVKGFFSNLANALILCGVLLLALIYFYFSFALFNNLGVRAMVKKSSYDTINQYRLVGAISMGLMLSTLLVGALFKVLMLTGANLMLLLGCSGTGLILAVALTALLIRKRAADYFYRTIFIRGGLLLIAGIFLFSFTEDKMIRFYHSDDPAYASLIIQAREHPEDATLQKRVDAHTPSGK